MRDDINWNDLDKPRFYSWSALLFLGVRAIVYPASLVKTRLQVEDAKVRGRTFATFGKIIRTEGLRSLYQGFTLVALAAIPAQMVYLSTYEFSRTFVSDILLEVDSSGGLSSVGNFVGGGLASLSSQVIVVPIDVVSQKLQIQKRTPDVKNLKNGRDVIRDIFSSQGLAGFYRGFFTSVLTYAPSSACWWSTYNFMRKSLFSLRDMTEIDEGASTGDFKFGDLALSGASGFIAGCVSAIITNPLDVMKTRLQTLEGGEKLHGPLSEWKLVKNNFRELYQVEGWRGFTRGIGARMLNMGPVSILYYSPYSP